DKITAEYLIKELGGESEEKAPVTPDTTGSSTENKEAQEKSAESKTDEADAEPSTSSATSEEPPTGEPAIKVIHAPEEETIQEDEIIDEPDDQSTTEAEVETEVEAPLEEEIEKEQAVDLEPEVIEKAEGETTAEVKSEETSPQPADDTTPEETSGETPAEQKPGLGAKVGFIQLPTRSGPSKQTRQADRKKEREQKRKAKQKERETGSSQQGSARGQGRGGAFQGGGVASSQPASPKLKPKFVQKYKVPETGEIITAKPPIIIRELALQIKRKPFQLIADLMELNVFATVNQAIEEPVAKQVCAKHGFRFEVEKREKGAGVTKIEEQVKLDHSDKDEDLQLRPPIVTIMGHVDHGKTTLLDVIRKSNVTSGEAGGITQHIGAYTIHFPHPERPKEIQQITFLDTPGHAAFSAMRARGANVTDIVILVVAADDGVMPQTLEALNHAKAAKVPIIVAVNKCDHPSANPMKARQQLQDRGLMCEEWGGETIFVDVSAVTKQGVDSLLEMVLLQAEVLELRANPDRKATGNIIESGMAQGGPTATVLVRKGTLKVGDSMICGPFWGRVKALINEEGKRLKIADPSVAVKVLGLNGVPEAGLEFNVVESEKQARKLAEERTEDARVKSADRRKSVTLENLFNTLKEGASKALKVIIKADTQGSTEAIVDALHKIESDKVDLDVIHSGVGSITDSDIMLASASQAIVIGFHTKLDTGVPDTAKREGVQIKLYSIIYELIDEMREAMAGLLDPITNVQITGKAEVRKVFDLSKGGAVAGSYVIDGKLVRGRTRVFRKEKLLFEGLMGSLRRFQDEVPELRAGMECGIRIDGFTGYEEGDIIETHVIEKVAQKL
ncbi:MAG: translation initiation factor IF-2, partial [Verrucomicrobia bacterium]|nr:translation initiation factor IF-2 [Verrucomicrobiota bacterium]